MVPVYYVQLEKLPRKVNGKLDVNAFPAPDLSSDEKIRKPATVLERRLAALWSEVLKFDIDQVSVEKSFWVEIH
jgi:hypothetical protein